MGWTKICELPMDTSTADTGGPSLWSREGLRGVEVHIGQAVIKIPRDVLLTLLAEDYRRDMVSAYEDMDDDVVLRRIGLTR